MSYVIIGGTNVLFYYRWDKCRGGTNVGRTNVGGTNVGGTKVAPPLNIVTNIVIKWQ